MADGNLKKALKSLCERHRRWGADGRMLEDSREELRRLCEERVPLGEIGRTLKEFGFSGSVDKLARWLDREGLRPRARRPRKARADG